MQLGVYSHTFMVFITFLLKVSCLNPNNLHTAAEYFSFKHREQFLTNLCLIFYNKKIQKIHIIFCSYPVVPLHHLHCQCLLRLQMELCFEQNQRSPEKAWQPAVSYVAAVDVSILWSLAPFLSCEGGKHNFLLLGLSSKYITYSLIMGPFVFSVSA